MIIRNPLRIWSVHNSSQRFLTSLSDREENSLKNIITPNKISPEYWKKVLLVAKDLKEEVRRNQKQSLKLLETNHVTLLFVKPHGRFQLAFTLACDLLGARRTLYLDPNFENQPSLADSGKVLSRLTDMLITHGLHHDVLIKLVSHNSTVPVFSASCNIHCLQKALSDFMTFQENLHRLKGLTLAWIGPPNSLFNSYLLLSSHFGITVRYTCICSYGAGRMSPVHRFSIENAEKEKHLSEYKTVAETVTGAHVIATSMHPQGNHRITLEVLKNADPNWVFIHSLPRTPVEVSDDVFHHENNLSWETSENYLYVAMAIILTSLKSYQHKEDASCFDGAGPGEPPRSLPSPSSSI